MSTSSLHKSLGRVALATAPLLMIPLIAMRFTTEVAWGPADFLAAAVLLFVTGTAMVIAARRIRRPSHRATVVAAIALGAALIWAELAVGLFR
jgi:hypothetical protein